MNRLIKKPMILLDRYGLLLLVVATLAAFVMACVEAHLANAVSWASVWHAVESVVAKGTHDRGAWAKVTNVLVSATMAWAAIRIYMASAGFKWDEFAARHLARGHVVIIGGPSQRSGHSSNAGKTVMATELALLLSRTHQVVLCLPSMTDGALLRLWDGGVIVLKRDFSVSESLAATRTSRAQLLIAMREDPGENIALARMALSAASGNPALRCMCMVSHTASRHGPLLKDYLEPETLSRVRVFSDAELIARRVVRQYPPDTSVALTDQGVHVLLVGMGSVGQAILMQLARIGHYRSGLKVKVTVVDRQAQSHWQGMTKVHPALQQWLQVCIVEKAIEDIGPAELERWLADAPSINVSYICTKNEVANLRMARLLLSDFNSVQGVTRPIVPQVVVLDPPGGCLMRDLAGHQEYRNNLRLFSLFDAGKDHDSPQQGFLWELDDGRARRLHEDYCAMDDARCASTPGATKAAANQPWEALPETYREANRASADHFDVKLRAVGRRIAPKHTAVEAPLTSAELEVLARMEHSRWWADRSLDGWQFGETRDNARKLHPDMVPYADLSEPVRQLDRDNVLHIIEILKGETGVLAMQAGHA